MSAQPQSNEATTPNRSDAGQIKDEGRESRLSFRRFAEHKMKREFKEAAIKKCDEHLKEFGQCAQDNGLLVVFRCRELNRRINDCMREHNSEEKFQAYLKENQEELERRTIRSKD
ncbi:hypothetical protein HJC23_006125 [Cyclotella cryptica]|uniref:COX assembly mitochondrial protein n=1 Tax=Cyclotella cryptica TaxID=29204 RepID=A0ABD3QJP0_9STRA